MYITVFVTPRSSKNQLIKVSDTEYKARLAAAPVDGAANEKLIELVSTEFGVAKSRISITRGIHSRKKIISIY